VATTTDTIKGIIDRGAALEFEATPAGVGILTLNRPERLNALDWPLFGAVIEVIEAVAESGEIKVLVLEGAGRAFCAGGDISFMRAMHEGTVDKYEAARAGERIFFGLTRLPQPTLSIVHGPAIGLGCTIALCCDLVFAGERALFADPHVQMGLVAGDGSAVLWPLLVGPARAKEFLFTGDPLNAAEADRLGLVNHVYAAEEVRQKALALAERLANGPERTIQATKSLVNHSIRSIGEQQVRGGLAMETLSQFSEYHLLAVEKFLAGEQIKF
jgi:enoyl-CoA hydratase